MPEYRRSKNPNGTYFFTVVTYGRQPILTTVVGREILRDSFALVQDRHPFVIDAICLLPDHIHCIWTLSTEDADYSLRWKEIKRQFTLRYLKINMRSDNPGQSRLKRHEAAIWQRRFWEHTIRDAYDLDVHRNYIHFNPVKHGLVRKVSDWPWSSFHQFVKNGFYDPEWSSDPEKRNEFNNYGE